MNPLTKQEQEELTTKLLEMNCVFASIAGSYRQRAAVEGSDVDVFCIVNYSHMDLLKGANKGVPQVKVGLSTGLVIDLRVHCLSVLMTLKDTFYPCLIEALMSKGNDLILNTINLLNQDVGILYFDQNVVFKNITGIRDRANIRSNAPRLVHQYDYLNSLLDLALSEQSADKSEHMTVEEFITSIKLSDLDILDYNEENECYIVGKKKMIDKGAPLNVFSKLVKADRKRIHKVVNSEDGINAISQRKMAAQYFRNFCIGRNLLLDKNTADLSEYELDLFKRLRGNSDEWFKAAHAEADLYMIEAFEDLSGFKPIEITYHQDMLDGMVLGIISQD